MFTLTFSKNGEGKQMLSTRLSLLIIQPSSIKNDIDNKMKMHRWQYVILEVSVLNFKPHCIEGECII